MGWDNFTNSETAGAVDDYRDIARALNRIGPLMGATVNNLPPTLTLDAAAVTTWERQTVLNGGMWLADEPNVTFTASVGTVAENDDGTWAWSYTPPNAIDQPSTVTITADDGEPDGTGSITFSLTVNNVVPTAVAGGPYCGDAGTTIQLDASGSYEPGNDIVSYAWDLTGNGQYDDASGITTLFEPAGPGTYTVGLKVTDAYGSGRRTRRP